MSRIGLIGIGDMGGPVGGSLVAAGHEVLTVLAGRGEESLARARSFKLEDVASLETLIEKTDVILSIVPPGIAESIAEDVARVLSKQDRETLYADLNAISPGTSRRIADVIGSAGARFVDGGIIGLAPWKTKMKTRIYLSGAFAETLSILSTDEINARVCGPDIGQASGLKMVYAALTKGTSALGAAVTLAVHQMGLMEAWEREMSESQPDRLAGLKMSVPFLAADSVRWADEMTEIAASFAEVGVTPKFHEGAEDLFRLLARSPLEAETRATMDRSRTLEAALDLFASGIESE